MPHRIATLLEGPRGRNRIAWGEAPGRPQYYLRAEGPRQKRSVATNQSGSSRGPSGRRLRVGGFPRALPFAIMFRPFGAKDIFGVAPDLSALSTVRFIALPLRTEMLSHRGNAL